MKNQNKSELNRRHFVQGIGAGAAMGTLGIGGSELFAKSNDLSNTKTGKSDIWQPYSDLKVSVGIAGYGLCRFGALFSYQSHPNVEVVAATDLDPVRCADLAKAVGAKKTYPSCEEMIRDKSIEAVYIATDAPSHARLAIMALNHGKHVVSAVPAVFGFNAEEDAEKLFEAVKKSGKKYQMNETSSFNGYTYSRRQMYQAGTLGKLIYSEGEDYQDNAGKLEGYNPKTGKVDKNGWRKGLVPMWYPTHATAYYVAVSRGRLTEVSCLGTPSIYPEFQKGGNDYNNRFGTQVALFKTSEGGMARMAVSWDMKNAHNQERGRVYGQKSMSKEGAKIKLPPLPSGVLNGANGQLTNSFIKSIVLDKKPYVDISEALNMTMSGVIAHKSALKDGEWMKVPQYDL